MAPNDVLQSNSLPTDGKETALFGEATWHITDQSRLTAGDRYFDTKRDLTSSQSGFLTFVSDSLTNYELGARFAWMDRGLTLDVTPYYIEWKDIQLRQGRPDGFAYTVNAGKARNLGVEVAVHASPTPQLSLDEVAGDLDATLREDVVDNFNGQTTVKAGSTLPMAATWNVMDSATYGWGGTLAPSVSAAYRYVGSAPANLAQTARVGNYSLFDLRARMTALGVQWEAFCDNLAGTRGVTTGWFTSPPNHVDYVRPRTYGVRLVYDLK